MKRLLVLVLVGTWFANINADAGTSTNPNTSRNTDFDADGELKVIHN